MSSLRTHLELGRVSNLPTVWTNVLAAAVLSGASLHAGPTLTVMLALSLFYVAGMYLNDAMDAAIDAEERPQRPVPSGRIDAASVRRWATVHFVAGFMLLAAARIAAPGALGSGSAGWLVSGLSLVGVIVWYDVSHKGNPYSPLLMGACRVLVLVVAACTLAGGLPATVVGGALVVLSWLVGLTYTAKREGRGRVGERWPLALLAAPLVIGVALAVIDASVLLPLIALGGALALSAHWMRRGEGDDIRRAVGLMIAGICLVDGILIASTGHTTLAVLAILAFVATLWLQRLVSGT